MTPEQIETLRAKARNCRDNARAEQAVVALFKADYLAGLSGSETASKETHSRTMELYDFYIGGQRREKGYLADAELFDAAADIAVGALPTD